jgi:hypothetical protein
METTGNLKMALAMSKKNLFTAVDSHVTVEEWAEFALKHPEALEVIFNPFSFFNLI